MVGSMLDDGGMRARTLKSSLSLPSANFHFPLYLESSIVEVSLVDVDHIVGPTSIPGNVVMLLNHSVEKICYGIS